MLYVFQISHFLLRVQIPAKVFVPFGGEMALVVLVMDGKVVAAEIFKVAELKKLKLKPDDFLIRRR